MAERRLELIPEGAMPPGTITWDMEAGTVQGDQAHWLRIAAEDFQRLGTVEAVQGMYITDQHPLKSEQGMAVALVSLGYHVPEELRAALPEADPGIDHPLVRH